MYLRKVSYSSKVYWDLSVTIDEIDIEEALNENVIIMKELLHAIQRISKRFLLVWTIKLMWFVELRRLYAFMPHIRKSALATFFGCSILWLTKYFMTRQLCVRPTIQYKCKYNQYHKYGTVPPSFDDKTVRIVSPYSLKPYSCDTAVRTEYVLPVTSPVSLLTQTSFTTHSVQYIQYTLSVHLSLL